MKTVLVCAYYFAPYAGVGWARALKFCKYLPENRWAPWVFTVHPGYYGNKVSEENPAEMAELRISHIPHVNFPGSVLGVKLLYPLLIFLFACRHRHKLDAVYLCGSPYHPFIMTFFLEKLLGLPAVLDFRDSWSLDPNKDEGQPYGLRKIKKFLRGLIERFSIRYASSAVFASSVLEEEYRTFLPRYGKKFFTIPNGYDPDDFGSVVPQRVTKQTAIIIAGKFYYYYPGLVELFFRLLKRFPALSFICVGGEGAMLRKLSLEEGVSDRTIILDYQPYSKTLGYIAGADYGLVVNSYLNGMGTKIFDYLALEKPTLCVVPQGSVIEREFKDNPFVFICTEHENEKLLEQSLRTLLATRCEGPCEQLQQFSRRKTAALLAERLNEIC